MIPKEKAKELFDKYFDMKWQSYSKRTTSIKSMTKSAAKQCALLAVEFAKSNPLNSAGYNSYLDNVKNELEKL